MNDTNNKIFIPEYRKSFQGLFLFSFVLFSILLIISLVIQLKIGTIFFLLVLTLGIINWIKRIEVIEFSEKILIKRKLGTLSFDYSEIAKISLRAIRINRLSIPFENITNSDSLVNIFRELTEEGLIEKSLINNYDKEKALKDSLTKKLRFKFDLYTFVFVIVFIILSVLFGFLFYYIFTLFEQFLQIKFQNAIYAIYAKDYIWVFPAMTAGTAMSYYIVNKMPRIILKNKYESYVAYQKEKHSIGNIIEKSIILILVAITFIFLFLSLNWYTIFQDNQIVYNPLFSLIEKKYDYTDISIIKTAPFLYAPNGNKVERREYVVQFNNGDKWTTDFLPTDMNVEQKKEIIKFVSKCSKTPINEVDILTQKDL